MFFSFVIYLNASLKEFTVGVLRWENFLEKLFCLSSLFSKIHDSVCVSYYLLLIQYTVPGIRGALLSWVDVYPWYCCRLIDSSRPRPDGLDATHHRPRPRPLGRACIFTVHGWCTQYYSETWTQAGWPFLRWGLVDLPPSGACFVLRPVISCHYVHWWH